MRFSPLRWTPIPGALLLLLATQATAQQMGTITGSVLDARSGRPLTGTEVTVVGTRIGAVTNAQGLYRMEAPAGVHRISATQLGYGAVTQEVTVVAGQSVTSDFRLEERVITLDELLVTGYAVTPRRERTGAQAQVTRGALYHHYGGKEGLFEAVTEALMAELHAQLGAAGAEAGDPLAALKLGIHRFLQITSRPATQRILLIDAPTVMGWSRWREMDRKYGFGLLLAALSAAASLKLIHVQSVEAAAHALLGAMIESSLVVTRARNKKQTLAEDELVLVKLVDSLR